MYITMYRKYNELVVIVFCYYCSIYSNSGGMLILAWGNLSALYVNLIQIYIFNFSTSKSCLHNFYESSPSLDLHEFDLVGFHMIWVT